MLLVTKVVKPNLEFPFAFKCDFFVQVKYKADLQKLKRTSSNFPDLLHLEHALAVGKLQSDVSFIWNTCYF